MLRAREQRQKVGGALLSFGLALKVTWRANGAPNCGAVCQRVQSHGQLELSLQFLDVYCTRRDHKVPTIWYLVGESQRVVTGAADSSDYSGCSVSQRRGGG